MRATSCRSSTSRRAAGCAGSATTSGRRCSIASPEHAESGRHRQGILLVLAGTSGAGKGTVGAKLRTADPGLHWSVSWTTRARRDGEVDGVDYRFVTREEFERLRDAGGFLEWFEVYGDLKGTPEQYVRDELAAGHDVMLEIDVQGAQAVRRRIPEALLVFVRAPSRDEQRRRLESRAETTGESAESIAGRLARADEEERIGAAEFDAVIVNDDADRAARQIADILENRRARLSEEPHA